MPELKLGIVSQLDNVMSRVATLRTYQKGFEKQLSLAPEIRKELLIDEITMFDKLESWIFEAASYPDKKFKTPQYLNDRLDIVSPVSPGDLILKKIKKYVDGLPCFKDYWNENVKLPYKKVDPSTRAGYRSKLKAYQNLKELRNFARLNEHTFRLRCEILSNLDKYMIFNSLTVDENYYEEVFKKGSRVFSRYIRKIDQLCEGEHMYYSVVERGGRNNRLHIHSLHIIQNLPDSWQIDPNYHKKSFPINREIYNMKKIWPYGHSSPIAVRFGAGDPYHSLGWRWPVDKKGNAYVSKGPCSLVNYLVKYITKSIVENSKIKEIQIWPTKMRRNFGMKSLEKIAQKMSLTQKLMVLENPQTICKLISPKYQLIPSRLLEKMVSRLILKNMTILPLKMRFLRDIESLKPMVDVVQDSIRTKCGFNPRNSTSVTLIASESMDVFKMVEICDDELAFLGLRYNNPVYGSSL